MQIRLPACKAVCLFRSQRFLSCSTSPHTPARLLAVPGAGQEVHCPAAGLQAEQLLPMVQAWGSGYAMSTEDELESIRQVALQTSGLQTVG